MNKPDDFHIDLLVNHPLLNPSEITRSLNIEPQFAWGVGVPVGSRIRYSTIWRGILYEGTGEIDFEQALERILSTLSDKHDFLSQVSNSGGELTLTIATVAAVQHGR